MGLQKIIDEIDQLYYCIWISAADHPHESTSHNNLHILARDLIHEVYNIYW